MAECFLLETLRRCLIGGCVQGTACGQVTQDLTCRDHEHVDKFVNINGLTMSWLACVIVRMIKHYCANKVDTDYIVESEYYCCHFSQVIHSCCCYFKIKNFVLVFVVNKIIWLEFKQDIMQCTNALTCPGPALIFYCFTNFTRHEVI